jgi:hypothetical protein
VFNITVGGGSILGGSTEEKRSHPPSTINMQEGEASLSSQTSGLPSTTLRNLVPGQASGVFSKEFLEAFEPRTTRGGGFQWTQYGQALTINQKYQINKELVLGRVSNAVLGSYLGISKQAVERIKAKFKGDQVPHDRPGRPPLLDNERVQELCDTIKQGQAEKKALTKPQTLDLIKNLAHDTALDKGRVPLKDCPADRKTVQKLYKHIKANVVKGQKTSPARGRESMDIRNFITMAAMNEAFGKGLPWHCIANMDATTFLLRFTSNDELVVLPSDDPPTTTEAEPLDIFVKQMFLTSASGRLAPPLFIISDNSMDREAFDFHLVKGLNYSMQAGDGGGYIAFCQSRQGNSALHQWIFTKYLVDFAHCMRGHLDGGPKGQDTPIYLVIDGEAIQSSTFDLPVVRDTIASASIDVGKGPASCSGVCGNALDVCNIFKGIKTRLRSGPALNEGRLADSELTDRLLALLLSTHPKISPENRGKLAQSLPRLLHEEVKTLNYASLTHGFERIGMIPPSTPRRTSLMSTLSCCPKTASLGKETMAKIVSGFPSLVEKMAKEGQITEAEMDAAEIPSRAEATTEKKDKDERVQYQQRAVLLTAAASVLRRQAWIESHKKPPPRQPRPKGEKRPRTKKTIVSSSSGDPILTIPPPSSSSSSSSSSPPDPNTPNPPLGTAPSTPRNKRRKKNDPKVPIISNTSIFPPLDVTISSSSNSSSFPVSLVPKKSPKKGISKGQILKASIPNKKKIKTVCIKL